MLANINQHRVDLTHQLFMEFSVHWRQVFLGILPLTILTFSTNSWAQDDDWLGEGDDDKGSERSEDDEIDFNLDEDPDEDTLDGRSSDIGEGLDLGEEYETQEFREEGEDDADIYRQFKEELERLDPAEEAISWQEYLEEYPKSLFRPVIEQRIEELEAELYGERIESQFDRKNEDGNAEIKLTQPVFLSNIDPRQKLHVGFELGMPSTFNVLLDYEHQIQRELSVHGGLRSSVSGTYFEPGVKYAYIKSARLQMLSTVNFDVMIGDSMGVRPTLGWGSTS